MSGNSKYPVEDLPLPEGDFWVFGFGSLMWNPGFEPEDAKAARLYGYHRRLCLWSIHYRGTKSKPGLVLGLDRGGSCQGMALKVRSGDRGEVAAYLCERELLSNAYAPLVKRVYLADGPEVDALTFVSRLDHPQFAPPMSIERTAAVVRAAEGDRGKNTEYLINTVEHLSQMGVLDTDLHAIAKRLPRG